MGTLTRVGTTLARMRKYRSLAIWKRSHDVVIRALRGTDEAYAPKARSLFDQLRRAAISVEANLVEGYALGTRTYYRKHLRIALGSAAEAEALLQIAAEMGYLSEGVIREIGKPLDEVIAMLFGMLRR